MNLRPSRDGERSKVKCVCVCVCAHVCADVGGNSGGGLSLTKQVMYSRQKV